VNPLRHPLLAALVAAVLVLMSAAWMRGAEYDEQYTLFVTAGVARPNWPPDAFPASDVRRLQAGYAGFAAIARDLRTTDVHPPLYFWTMSMWRALIGNSLLAVRLASVLFSLAALGMVAVIARLAGIPPVTAVLLTVGCYGFTYAGTIARGFALAQLLTLSGVAALLFAELRASGWTALAAGALLGAATFSNYLAAFVGGAALVWTVTVNGSAAAGLGSIRNRVGVHGTNSTLPLSFRERAWAAGRRFGDEEYACRLPLGEAGNFATPPLPSMPLGFRPRLAVAAAFGFAVWLPADLWFFLAQRQNRLNQFAPFDAASATVQLARYFAADLLGGLPLYFGGIANHVVAAVLASLLVMLTGLTIWQWRAISVPRARMLLAMAAAAPALGLLLLGLAFNNAPIELRYLAFAMPFVGLLLAGVFATLPPRTGRTLSGLVLAIQTLSLVGLMTRPETMQPARATAEAAVALVDDGVVLLPRGNDGVGIVGAFAIEVPAGLRLLVVGKDASATEIRTRAGHFRRVVLALLGQDADSRATLPVMLEVFADPCWRRVGEGFNVLAFERICGDE
jgi:Dolichyl-phosphate-mannose-protein mannosyltransferase